MRAPNNLNILRAFEAVARHLSYPAAAAELNVTPAAVGQLIRGLESYLDVELFHRASSGPSRLTLTDAARARRCRNCRAASTCCPRRSSGCARASRGSCSP